MTTRKLLLGKFSVWLILFDVDGVQYRLATERVEIVKESGGTEVFDEGLAPLELGHASLGEIGSSIGIEINSSVSWESLIASFSTIEQSPCTVRLWYPDQTLEQTELYFDGSIQGFNYSRQDEPVTFSIVRFTRHQSILIPSPSAVVDSTTWPVRTPTWAIDDKIIGQFYPIIFGQPGHNGTAPGAPCSPALLVESQVGLTTNRLIVAGHRTAAVVARLWDMSQDPPTPRSVNITVHSTTDLAGRTVSYVEDLAVNSVNIAPGREYAISWPIGGGIPHETGSLEGAGDIIEYLLIKWAKVKFDVSRFAEIKDTLNAYRLAFYLNDPQKAEDVLMNMIYPLLPIEPRQGVDGLYFYLRQPTVEASESLATLDADKNEISLESTITLDSEQVVNQVTIEYRPDAKGRYLARVTVGATSGVTSDPLGQTTTDTRVVGSYRARLSQGLLARPGDDGVRSAMLQAPVVWDEATAIRIAQDIIAAQALPTRRVDYSGPPELAAYSAGDIITLQDSTVGISMEIARVLDVLIQEDGVLMSFELIDDPLIMNRSV